MPRVLVATCAALARGRRGRTAARSTRSPSSGSTPPLGVWDDPRVDWGAADLVVVRSTWDYTEHAAAFLAWAPSVADSTTRLAVLAWNTDKHYLDELAARGVADRPDAPTSSRPTELVRPTAGRFVVKPTVGAGSMGASALRRRRVAEAARPRPAPGSLEGATAMVQPYLELVVNQAGDGRIVFSRGVSATP